jgi:hypothetical protein
MHNTRRGILAMVASGRVTPAEAERLLVVWDEGTDWKWIVGACSLLCLVQILGGDGRLAHLVHAYWVHGLWAEAPRVLHAAISGSVNRIGGGI